MSFLSANFFDQHRLIVEKEIFFLDDLEKLAKEFLFQFQSDEKVALVGLMGSGKTALTRFFLRWLGYTGVVSSPTFTLVEEYHFFANTFPYWSLSQKKLSVLHMDLYRLEEGAEDDFGIRQMLNGDSLVFVEWAEKIDWVLGCSTHIITIDFHGEARNIKLFSKN